MPRFAEASDDHSDDAETKPTKKSRRKRSRRNQASRSIRSLPAQRQIIVQASYPFLQKGVALYWPWPTASPSGDPSADDDEIEGLIENAWEDAVDFLNLDPDDVDARTDVESSLIRARISQVRGAIMKEADALVGPCYGFLEIGSLTKPTPEKIEETRAANRDLVEALTGTFMYKDPKDTSDIATICHHPIFQKLLNAAFFAAKGVNRRIHYFAGMHMLPVVTFGLLMDSVVCGIDRWKTGEHQSVDFDAEGYLPVHKNSMEFLDAWLVEYQKEVHPKDLARGLLHDLLSNARSISETPVEKERTGRSMFPMGVFSK
ncbi:hypothetical protein DFH09DRAFT_1414328 [Mycena vulgaris]|nr:hypothetical protein DFH09DRAFT_1414328 [Mycena vulgaris]